MTRPGCPTTAGKRGVMTTLNRKPLFDRLRHGLTEGIAHARGESTLTTVELPEAPPEIDAANLAALRALAAMSQAVFAKMLNVSPKTVQSWEQGTRSPSMASRRLIHVFSMRPDAVCQVVGLRTVTLPGVRIETGRDGKRRIVLIDVKDRRKPAHKE